MHNILHTPFPWIDEKPSDSIIAPNAKRPPKEIMDDETFEYYGGPLVCESVCRWDKAVIKASPELLELIQSFVGLLTQVEKGRLLNRGLDDFEKSWLCKARKTLREIEANGGKT